MQATKSCCNNEIWLRSIPCHGRHDGCACIELYVKCTDQEDHILSEFLVNKLKIAGQLDLIAPRAVKTKAEKSELTSNFGVSAAQLLFMTRIKPEDCRDAVK